MLSMPQVIEQSLFLFSPVGKWNGKEKNIYIEGAFFFLPHPPSSSAAAARDSIRQIEFLSPLSFLWEMGTNERLDKFPATGGGDGGRFLFFLPTSAAHHFSIYIFFFGRRGEINGETRCGALLSSSSSSRERRRKASNFRSTPPPPISFSSSFAKWKRLLYLEGMPTAFRKGGGGGGGK